MNAAIPPLHLQTIPAAKHSADDLLGEWRWLVPDSYTPHLLSAFGDQFLVAPDGTLHFLCLLDGTLQTIAPDLASLHQRLDTADGQRQWLFPDWVGLAYERGLIRQSDQCYGWRLAPLLGGPFEFANLQLFTLRVCESIMGQLHRQMQGHPPGYRITGFTHRE